MPIINQNDESKHNEHEEYKKLREARRNQFIEFAAILVLAGLVVALALSVLFR